jgi:hypothetical protein
MRKLLVLSSALFATTPAFGQAPESEAVEQVDLGTHDVLERLKLLRVQMALDREEIAALELRIERLNLEREFAALSAGVDPKAKKASTPKASTDPSTEFLVKAISLKPRKEAIVLYRGRVFNIRPGDSLGGVMVKDITESGLQIVRNKGGKASPVVR